MTTPTTAPYRPALRRLRGLVLALALPAAIGFAQSDQNAGSTPADQTTPAESTAAASTTTPAKAIKLEQYTVLGSHIASPDVEGISPVVTLDQNYIQASGFLTTSDLLNSLPQVYAGAGAGPGSVPNMNNPASGTTAFAFDFSTYAPDIGQTGVSGVSLGGLGGANTLVLIDGRRAPTSGIGNESNPTNASFFNINTIPLAMIDHIEILPSGASAIYGADAVGGVVNIVLKKHFNGSELQASFKTSQHGGGTQYSATLTNGFTWDKLNALVILTYNRSLGLKASQRPFSATEDHTAQGGSNLGLTYGFPATVESVSSGFFGAPPLNGVKDANGNPVTIAFVPAGQDGTNLKPSQFIGLTTPPGKYYPYTYNPRQFDAAPYISLLTPAKNWGTRLHVDYQSTPNVNLYTDVNLNRTTSNFTITPPAIGPGGGFGFGPSITVPASDPDNPFGQPVTIGMTDANFGPRTQSFRADSVSVVAGAQGTLTDIWNWDSYVSYAYEDDYQYQRDLDYGLVNASFYNANASQRYNPFAGAYSASNAALYPSLTGTGVKEGFSGMATASLNVNGQPLQLPGGKLGVAFGGDFHQIANHSTTTTQAFYNQMPYTSLGINTWDVYGETAVPIFGQPNHKPLFDRLDLQLAARYDSSGPFHRSTPQIGLVWEPVKSVLLRGTYSQNFRAPSLTEYGIANVTNPPSPYSPVIDPRRGSEVNNNVSYETGQDPNIQPEISTVKSAGIILEPPFVKGLSFGADYQQTRTNNEINANLAVQDIVNNESAFPGRVVRGPVPAGDPYNVGPITFVDDRLGNFGTIQTSSINYHFTYDLPWQEWGQFELNASAVRILTFNYDLTPGQPFQSQIGDTASPPKWKGLATLRWTKANWTAMLFAYYTGGFYTNNSGNYLDYVLTHMPSWTTLDLNVGYQFSHGIWNGYGKDVRVAVGVQNLADRYPPFSNSIFGYNASLYSPLGRTFTVQLTVPF